MKVLSTKYEVWRGDDFLWSEDTYEEAKKRYDKFPSGQGKAPSLRRELSKVEVLLRDDR
jgi:hypothetical protein